MDRGSHRRSGSVGRWINSRGVYPAGRRNGRGAFGAVIRRRDISSPVAGTVLFLGAGATKSVDGPMTDEILPALYAANRESRRQTIRWDRSAKS